MELQSLRIEGSPGMFRNSESDKVVGSRDSIE